jgi:hypothetical protein
MLNNPPCLCEYKPLKYYLTHIFNVYDVIFSFGSSKMKTRKFKKNNDPFKTFKKYVFGTKKLKNKQKLQLIWTYENMVKF